MKYLLILGRNIELSKQEILAYFEKEGNPVLESSIVGNGMLIEIENEVSEGEIQNLGGVISIGEVIAFGRIEALEKKLDEKIIYSGSENKLTYVIWNFSHNYETIQDYLKVRFKSEKLKATEKHLTGRIEMQTGEKLNTPSSKLLNDEYFLFEEEGLEYFGKIIEKYDYSSLEKRDMGKPIRREELAISPRLAKVMINLAQLKRGDTLFDPFCGVGTILQEALLQEIKVLGVDIDLKATQDAEKNMRWFGFSKNNYSIINFDSKKVDLSTVSAIATEPDLGDIIRKTPTKEKAKQSLRDFEKLMILVIENAKEKVSGRIVFSSPMIRTGKKRLTCNIENICEKTGYTEIIPGIEEYRGNQIIGRKIFVLGKK